MWQARIITLFPEMFPGPLGHSLAGKALSEGIWELETINLRDFGEGRHAKVDDTPAGGGPGMVLRADVMGAAIDTALADRIAADQPLIYLSPRGKPLDQRGVESLRDAGGATLICGRFEGLDERVLEARGVKEVSVGDYVLSGGEPAAIVLLDAVIRLLPGVLGAAETLEEESFTSGVLEYPQYTRPQTWEGRSIPEVLTSGDHGAVAKWRREMAEKLTKARRPDIWAAHMSKKVGERKIKKKG